MKKLIFIFWFIPILCFSQSNNIVFNNKTVISMNQATIDYVLRNQNFIKSFNGKTKIYIPYEKTFMPNVKSTYIENQFVQYEWTFTGLWDVTIFKPKTKYYICDFTKEFPDPKVIKDKKIYDNDDLDIFKPKDLKNKIKIK